MDWRIVACISYCADEGPNFRNNGVVKIVNEMGLHRTATGTCEADFVNELLAARKLGELFLKLADPSQVEDVSDKTALKHVWI